MRTLVIELYTSEGCSSCPPADKWLSTLKASGAGIGQEAVAVVRQYTPVGDYPADGKTPQKLQFRSIPTTPGHPRQINLVVFDPKTGKTLQAVSAPC
jgi:hypothetical protein